MFEAFLDDYNVITVKIKNNSYKNELFLLLDYDKFFNLSLKSSLIKDDYYHLTFTSEHEIILGKKYYIYSNDGINCLLVSRKIVDTTRFENENYYEGYLGNKYCIDYTEFHLWAPLAFCVLVIVYKKDNSKVTKELVRGENGSFYTRLKGNLEGCKYYYLIENNHQFEKSYDPYANASAINNRGSSIIDLKKLSKNLSYKNPENITDAIIYEASIRDSSSLIKAKFSVEGYYNQFVQKGLKNNSNDMIGYDYLKNLGITHVQLMPVQYCGSIDESLFFRRYNWGYDIMQHNVVEGYYSSDPLDPYKRINELKNLINTLHSDNIGVVLDVVYNHVYDVDASCFNKTVPGYYFRYNEDGYLHNGSGCGNDFASEKKMVQRYIVDSIYRLAIMYNVDGFRFDLMGLLDIKTMNLIIKKLKTLKRVIYLYGEGWELNTKISNEELCVINNAVKLKGVSFFSEQLRDNIKGSTFNANDIGIAQGEVEKYQFIKPILQARGDLNIDQTINYLSCHDNHTLFDRYLFNNDFDLKRSIKLSYTFLLLSRGVPFMHMGCEFLRSKKGIGDSYVSDDSVNGINWDLVTTNKDVIEHVKDLIKIRKYFSCFKSEMYEDFDVNIEKGIVFVKYDELLLYINLKKENSYINIYDDKLLGVYVNGVLNFEGFSIQKTVVIDPGSFLILK